MLFDDWRNDFPNRSLMAFDLQGLRRLEGLDETITRTRGPRRSDFVPAALPLRMEDGRVVVLIA
jgi:hypothetical protein